MRQFFNNLLKYIVEGLVVAVVAYYIPQRQTNLKTVGMIGLIAALTFALLDYFSPSIGASSRLGAGFGIGSNLVGFGPNPINPSAYANPSLPTLGGGAEAFTESPVASMPQYLTVNTVVPGNGAAIPVTDGNNQVLYVQAGLPNASVPMTTMTSSTPGYPVTSETVSFNNAMNPGTNPEYANPLTQYAAPTNSEISASLFQQASQ